MYAKNSHYAAVGFIVAGLIAMFFNNLLIGIALIVTGVGVGEIGRRKKQ